MSDAAALESWLPRFEGWRDFALPLIGEGKTKEAFGKYPWFSGTSEDSGTSKRAEPFARLDKPVGRARFGLVTTGGYSIEGEQEPMKPIPNFDGRTPQMRTIPLDVDRSKLRIDHPGYDHRFAEEDINVNLPFDRLAELVEAGEIGSIAQDTPVLMGLVPNVAPLIRETIPALVQRFRDDAVDAVLLVPS
jgi:hypothetical protein